ncbi:hypothetical protein NE547_04025 [Flavonifractor sp. DFI.6.63]|uniref:hypothetical protein n=1 Tax=Flavonifractor sp. DFI.6.63 TaxID=2963704 RepID=UPI00210CDEE0|nr:hypothetical protein [Flavonifractor sp. DFI.6.63]MCQ5028702.1 hypothetical protein [Flavonifractor sp. DFI.6.63]
MRTIGLIFPSRVPDEKYVCPACGKEYKSEAALSKHLQEKHPNTEGPKTEQEATE